MREKHVSLRWLGVLVREPTNRYDPNAVNVVIAGKHVGHLSGEVAIVFVPVAEKIRELGCEVQCGPIIGGGGGVHGVVLDLRAPDDCLKECTDGIPTRAAAGGAKTRSRGLLRLGPRENPI